jgi:GR25 family glycosyltransferase involved in LPS biosynthesis
MVLPFDKIYFISLTKSSGLKRRILLNEQFEKLSITDKSGNKPEWIIAENGMVVNHIIDNLFRKKTLRKGSVSLSEVGCFSSHRKTWLKFLESGLETCLILEDDALFGDLSIFDNWEQFPEWDFINFGFIKNRASIVDNLELIIKSQFHGLWKGSGMWLTHAYAINQTACKILLKETETQTGGLDWQLTGIQPMFKSFGFMPARISQQPLKTAPSQIHHTQ